MRTQPLLPPQVGFATWPRQSYGAEERIQQGPLGGRTADRPL